jgi:hypothetical protein
VNKARRFCFSLPSLALAVTLASIASPRTGLCDDDIGEYADAESLAAAYAAAFIRMNEYSVTILYQNGSGVEALCKTKKITPIGAGALLVRNIRGHEQIIHAQRIVKIAED